MYIYFRAEYNKKYQRYQKMLQIRIVQNETYYKKLYEHSSLSPRSGTKGLQRLQFLKYYEVLEWESWLTLELNATKSTDCTEWKMRYTKMV